MSFSKIIVLHTKIFFILPYYSHKIGIFTKIACSELPYLAKKITEMVRYATPVQFLCK